MRRCPRPRPLLAAGLGLLLLSGCAGFPKDPGVSTVQAEYARPIQVAGVPHYVQDDYQCGPAALASVLTWSGEKVSPDSLRDDLYIPAREGTLQVEIASQARRHGRIPYRLQGGLPGLLEELDAGHPVLVLENLGLGWAPVWHYSVVYGFAPQNSELRLRSGTEGDRLVELDTFSRTWGRAEQWGLVILTPDKLPAAGTVESVLEAVAPLEQLGDTAAANTAYRSAARRWPDSAPAHVALGNTWYALGDYTAAEAAYRRATENDPHHGAAYNNLAFTLAQQKRWEEAIEAAGRAVEIGGPFEDEYRNSLQEIRARISSGPVRD